MTSARSWPWLPLVSLASTAALAAQQPAPVAGDELSAAFAAAMPPPAEARWTLVPWRHSLTLALAEARALQRPVYVFVNDGDVESGRC